MTGSSAAPAGIALDTSRAIAVLNGDSMAATQAAAANRVYLPVPVVAELLFGALNSRNAAENIARIEQFRAGCEVLEVKATTAAVYARVRLALKQKGRPIPENDLWIAAVCVENVVPIATDDVHFSEVDGLRLAG